MPTFTALFNNDEARGNSPKLNPKRTRVQTRILDFDWRFGLELMRGVVKRIARIYVRTEQLQECLHHQCESCGMKRDKPAS
jgi:hypothetical protein